MRNRIREKIRTLIMLISSIAWYQSVAAGGVSKVISRSWQEDYDRIQQEIAEHRSGALMKSGAEEAPSLMDKNALIWDSDRDALDVQLRRLQALLDHLKTMPGAPDLTEEEAMLKILQQQDSQTVLAKTGATAARQKIYMDARALTRQVAMQNPLLDFDEIIFNTFEHQITKNNIMNHDQDVGYSAAPGGGIGVITDYKSDSPSGRNLMAGVQIENGPYAGLDISTANGSFNSFDLSWDGTQIVFSWSRRGDNPWDTWTPYESEFWVEDNTFHLFTFDVGGATCRQLTFGNRSDHSPCWLPNGRIAFMSERRNSTARCAASRHQPTSAMYSIKADGSDLIRLSWHDTEEWDPSVNNDGMLVYTRWDYLDRDFHIAHNFWICYPDGRDPRAPHGNYPLPHTTLEGDRWEDGRAWRPWGEYNIRAIPGSGKYIAIAGGHHNTGMYGTPIILDVSIPDDNMLSQITRITPGDCWINEACPANTWGNRSSYYSGQGNQTCSGDTHYGHPWALSEDFYMVTENQGNRLFLLDRFGNREVLYLGFEIPNVSGMRMVSPIPFRAREKPPVIPTATWQGERDDPNVPRATISVMNVYESDFEWPENTKITALRILQHIPRPWSSPVTNQPRIGYSDSPTARVVLGTVPVEEDGSAYFEAPIEKLIYFQALDENGMAVQSMRSGTYVHPGEHLSCTGCHEDKWKVPQVPAVPLAMQRSPSKIEPEAGGVEPVNFHRLARPVFDSKCKSCHQSQNQAPDFSYGSLEPYAFYFHGDGQCNHLSWLHGGSRTIAGKFGARWSRLYKEGYLDSSHYDVNLTDEELRRIIVWLDANSLEMPSFSLDAGVQSRARSGELVWPELDVDPANPQGIELDREPPAGIREYDRYVTPPKNKGNPEFSLTVQGTVVLVGKPSGTEATVRISSPAGRVINSFEISERTTEFQFDINTNSLPHGMYIVTVTVKGRTIAGMLPYIN
jgi:hypothetical protein